MRWVLLLITLFARSAFGDSISGTVVTVIDGDTLIVQDAAKKRHRVRLAEIDAPEPKQPLGVRSARSLAALCYKKEAHVEWSKSDSNGRKAGHVTCAGRDANEEQVRRGMAWASPKATGPGSALYEAEAYARLRMIGLWADEKALPPWEWRAQEH
ncbi:MAG: nuclease [Betaproteobacteria bacterium]|nr:MAG: nuclease [Betaproteobacteria bacterium]